MKTTIPIRLTREQWHEVMNELILTLEDREDKKLEQIVFLMEAQLK